MGRCARRAVGVVLGLCAWWAVASAADLCAQVEGDRVRLVAGGLPAGEAHSFIAATLTGDGANLRYVSGAFVITDYVEGAPEPGQPGPSRLTDLCPWAGTDSVVLNVGALPAGDYTFRALMRPAEGAARYVQGSYHVQAYGVVAPQAELDELRFSRGFRDVCQVRPVATYEYQGLTYAREALAYHDHPWKPRLGM